MGEEKVKIKRIGLYSMGLILIASGVLMIFSEIFKFDLWDLSIKLWPLILISLGLEVLYLNHKNNEDENIKIKFSFLSILTIFFIVFINLGLYSLTKIGLADRIKEEINMINHDTKIYENHSDLNDRDKI